MLTLLDLKKYLRIDFNDHDGYLILLLQSAISRASEITGIDLTQDENLTPDLKEAILEDVANRYQTTGEAVVLDKSMIGYRQHSVRPMF